MFSVLTYKGIDTVNDDNLLEYTLDGHLFGLEPLESQMNELQEYEGAVEEKVYQMEVLKHEEKEIKKKMNRIYLDLVYVDYRLEQLENHLNRIRLLQSTLYYPRQWSPPEVASNSNAHLYGTK